MTKRFAGWFVALVALAFGCAPSTTPTGQVGSAPRDSTSTLLSALTDRVWARSDSTGLPGVMHVFLPNGTLLIDSCWETYRLCKWQMDGDSSVTWQEDASTIRAAIVRVDDDSLTLRLALVDGPREERYAVAPLPYLCPDMKR